MFYPVQLFDINELHESAKKLRTKEKTKHKN